MSQQCVHPTKTFCSSREEYFYLWSESLATLQRQAILTPATDAAPLYSVFLRGSAPMCMPATDAIEIERFDKVQQDLRNKLSCELTPADALEWLLSSDCIDSARGTGADALTQ